MKMSKHATASQDKQENNNNLSLAGFERWKGTIGEETSVKRVYRARFNRWQNYKISMPDAINPPLRKMAQAVAKKKHSARTLRIELETILLPRVKM